VTNNILNDHNALSAPAKIKDKKKGSVILTPSPLQETRLRLDNVWMRKNVPW